MRFSSCGDGSVHALSAELRVLLVRATLFRRSGARAMSTCGRGQATICVDCSRSDAGLIPAAPSGPDPVGQAEVFRVRRTQGPQVQSPLSLRLAPSTRW
jgi:hypothetical protein